MQIGILTLYYDNHNFGGQLQAYALCTYLNQQKNIECEQIAYDYKERTIPSIKSRVFSAYSHVFHPRVMIGLNKRKKTFETFEEAIPHSVVVRSVDKLAQLTQKYDYVFTGSDQVWNPEYAGKAFYLGEIPAEKRCAYAASFGKDRLQEGALTENTIKALKNYCFISVREDSAVQILEQYGIPNVNMVCDPTLLLKKREWEDSIAQVKRITNDKYVFVYLLGNSQNLRDDLKKKLRSTNLKIVSIPHIHFTYQKRDKGFADIEAYDVGPLEFLKLINDAEMVVTDSFHCTLFSILFQKNFWTLSRNGKNDLGSTNGRMYTLLEKAGLMERYAGSVEKIRLQDTVLRNDAEIRLSKYAEFSRKLLADFLNA